MLQRLQRCLRSLPTPLAGLALGIVSLGTVWEQYYPLQGYSSMLGAIIAGIILLALCLRIIFYPTTLMNDFSHHVLGSLVPTLAMASMVIASVITPIHFALATGIWLTAIVLHSIALLVFIYFRWRDSKWEQMVPSWFIPLVGIVVAVFTCPDPVRFQALCLLILVVGLCNYALLLPIMLNRLIFGARLAEYAKPTVAILAAPASLCLTGYLSIVAEPSPVIVAVLFGIALLMTWLVYVALLYLLRLDFTPGFASYTFPLVISTKAIAICIDWSQRIGLNGTYVAQLELLGMLELVVATVVVLWVSRCYLIYLFKSPMLEK